MAKRLDTEIIINLAGNLTAKARQYGANMSEFARRNERAMSVIKSTSAAAGRGLDMLGNRYTTTIAGFAGGAMLRNFAATDRRITRLGISADKTKEQINSIYSNVQDISIQARIDDKEIVGFLETVNAMTGDIEFGIKNIKAAALTIAGTGSSGESIGALFSQFKKYGISDDQNSALAMDVLNRLGKEGAFELKDLAEKAGPSLSLYAAAGGRGVKGIKEVGVLLESAIDATGNRDTAATLVENFIREIQDPKIAKALRLKGVNTRDTNGQLKPLPDLLLALARGSMRGAEKAKLAGNKDASALGELKSVGFTQTSLDLISGASGKEGQENLQRYNAVIADGKSIQEDAAYVAKDFTSAIQSMTTTWEKFANSQLAAPVQELADALNSVDQETVQNWLEIGKNVALATGGLLAARKAFQIGKGAYDFLRPGKKGVPQGVTDVFGSGVMPVYVVNMGGSGLGSPAGGGKGVPSTVGGAAAGVGGASGFWGLAARAIGGAGMVYGMSELADYGAKSIYEGSGLGDAVRGSSFRDWISESVDSTMLPKKADAGSVWKEVTDWLTSAPHVPEDPRPWANQSASQYPFIPQQLQGEIEVTVKDDRVQVSKIKINTPGVTMSAQTGIRNVGQD